jgi:hypothetical protein
VSQLPEIVKRLIEGFRDTALIATAVRLKIIDGLDSEPRFPRELAEPLRLDERALTRFLRGLAVLKIVKEHPAGLVTQFSLTPAGLLLRSDADGQLARYALLCEKQYLPAWTSMETALSEGLTPFQSVFGKPVWQHRLDNPEQGSLFNQWLHGQSSTIVDDLVAALDFFPFKRVADIGGGIGIVLSRILQHFPGCRGVLAEQPSVLKQAERFLHECGLLDRCDLTATDFFVSAPMGCDAYLLESVLHDWDDEDCIRILVSLREAMSPGSRLFLIERILPVMATEEPETIWIDLMMMNITGGRERTLREYEALLDRANLSIARSIRTASKFHIMEVVRR